MNADELTGDQTYQPGDAYPHVHDWVLRQACEDFPERTTPDCHVSLVGHEHLLNACHVRCSSAERRGGSEGSDICAQPFQQGRGIFLRLHKCRYLDILAAMST